MAKFQYLISPNTAATNLTTTSLFNDEFEHSRKSAIDDFVEKRRALFALLKPYENDIDKVPNELTNMILLGSISAVESYVRKIIRTIINVDKRSREKCEGENLKYGAVLFHTDETMLPEALLEGYSFADGNNIKTTINKLLDINCNSPQVNKVLEDFSKICQLRHCVVHRFGLLGSHNAIKLGLSEHKEYIEKPLQINFDNLNEMVQVCENVVKVLNNFLFCEIIERTYKDNLEIWYSDYRKDKKTFKKYFNLFNDSFSSCDEKAIYKTFLKTMHDSYGKDFQTNGRTG